MARSMTSWATQPLLRPELLLAPTKPAAAGITTREIFQGHAEFVMRLVRRLGVRASDVDDVTQEVFVIVHRRLADLQAGVPVRSWLFGIARRVVANYRRQLQRRQELPSPQLEEVAVPCDQVSQLQSSRDRAQLEYALSKLDSEKREVFVLFELEGVDMKDVADMVGCPLNTAYSRLYAARQVVRQALTRTPLRRAR
ncbi:MAG TPA: sigma-70 family RNA polymerase sigma factor [Polyangiales bacterium]|nr:sigma-70 family RNA polymerase sigma factor [Polyangiales bacterium]